MNFSQNLQVCDYDMLGSYDYQSFLLTCDNLIQPRYNNYGFYESIARKISRENETQNYEPEASGNRYYSNQNYHQDFPKLNGLGPQYLEPYQNKDYLNYPWNYKNAAYEIKPYTLPRIDNTQYPQCCKARSYEGNKKLKKSQRFKHNPNPRNNSEKFSNDFKAVNFIEKSTDSKEGKTEFGSPRIHNNKAKGAGLYRTHSNKNTREAKQTTNQNRICRCNENCAAHGDVLEKVLLNLYKEEIPPSLDEIRRRLDKLEICPYLISNCFEICRSDKLQRFKLVKLDLYNNEEFIYLTRKPDNFIRFIDPNSLELPYSIDLIPLVFIYLVDRYKIDPTGESYRGGRFLLAELLKSEGPYALRMLTQGKLCHLLQKCLDLGFLSYENNAIRPAVACSTLCRAYFAKNITRTSPETQAKDIEQFKLRLKKSLEKYPTGLAMCRLPVIYKTEYGTVLNVESFGFTKLADLLESVASDICTIKPAAKHRCVILPKTRNDPKTYCSSKSHKELGYRLSNGELKTHQELTSYLIDNLRTLKWSRFSTFTYWYLTVNGELPKINCHMKSKGATGLLNLIALWKKFDELEFKESQQVVNNQNLFYKNCRNKKIHDYESLHKYTRQNINKYDDTTQAQYTTDQNDSKCLPAIKILFKNYNFPKLSENSGILRQNFSLNQIIQGYRHNACMDDVMKFDSSHTNNSGTQLPLQYSCLPAETDLFQGFHVSSTYTKGMEIEEPHFEISLDDLRHKRSVCSSVYFSLFEDDACDNYEDSKVIKMNKNFDKLNLSRSIQNKAPLRNVEHNCIYQSKFDQLDLYMQPYRKNYSENDHFNILNSDLFNKTSMDIIPYSDVIYQSHDKLNTQISASHSKENQSILDPGSNLIELLVTQNPRLYSECYEMSCAHQGSLNDNHLQSTLYV